ncbi:MAG: hypothetical protein ACFB0E_13325 [Leptolyngbyaceae cyanobacterium]
MNSEMSAIREQLLAEYSPVTVETPSRPRGMSSPELPDFGQDVAWQSPQQGEGAQALRQRGIVPAASPPSPEEQAASSASSSAGRSAPPDIHRYLQRLYEEAEKINELYRQQEMTIRKFQSTFNGLSLILMKQSPSAMLKIEQICEIRDAASTQVVQDENHRYVLTAVDLDLTSDVKDASETAAALRDRAHPASSFSAVSPIASIKDLWSQARIPWPASGHIFSQRSPTTFLNYLIWCGGGVIGRLALDLLLAAFPRFWPVVIGLVVGAVAFGLYRLLFAKKTDMTSIVCVFLALIGLVIGGQL